MEHLGLRLLLAEGKMDVVNKIIAAEITRGFKTVWTYSERYAEWNYAAAVAVNILVVTGFFYYS